MVSWMACTLLFDEVSAIDIHIMLQLDAHINSHFNHDNGIKLNAKGDQIIYRDYETAAIPGRFGPVD